MNESSSPSTGLAPTFSRLAGEGNPTLLDRGQSDGAAEMFPIPPEFRPDSGALPDLPRPAAPAKQESVRPPALPDVKGAMTLRRTLDAAEREAKLKAIIPLKDEQKLSWRQIEERTGVPFISARRYYKKVKAGGSAALLDNMHLCGRKPQFPELTKEEQKRLMFLYLHSNNGKDTGSMVSAAQTFAEELGTREELRAAILPDVLKGHVPDGVKRILERVTPTHVAMERRPKHTSSTAFSGNVGAFVGDMADRLRVVESDDGTLNFGAYIPWAIGGDPCSDRYGVRLGRWQFLPAVDAGWTRMYYVFAIVCRPRGGYRKEDIRALIYMLARAYGLPDKFRFERGGWESDDIVRLIQALGVALETVWSPDQKPIIEGGFSILWEYLSQIDGQVGRYRGDEERGNQMMQKCQAGREDPREHFPSLQQCVNAIVTALARANSRTVHSIYGTFIPEERCEILRVLRPWKPLPAHLEYKFCPFVREWTVIKGTVGGMIPILEDYNAPFYFAHDDLWRWNGRRVRLYFDIKATPCLAVVESTEQYNGYRPDEVICHAELLGGLPHFCRAQLGIADEERQVKWRSAALSALRMDLRALGPRGQVTAAITEERDGSGSFARVETGLGGAQTSHVIVEPQRLTPPPSSPRTMPATLQPDAPDPEVAGLMKLFGK
jgi:hypothetical protein